MSESNITEDRVRDEHLKEVGQVAHWSYLVGVIGISLAAMIGLIALLGR